MLQLSKKKTIFSGFVEVGPSIILKKMKWTQTDSYISEYDLLGVFRPTSTLLDLTLKPGQFLGVRSDLGLPMMASNPVDADYSTYGAKLPRGRVAVEVYGFKPDLVKGIYYRYYTILIQEMAL